jgi:hypothetical protein
MQWFKSALVVSTVLGVAAMAGNGCSSKPAGSGDAGDSGNLADIQVKDQKAPPSDGGGDSGSCATAAVSCEMCDVSGYTPATMGAVVYMQNACTATQISNFVTACALSTSTMATCSAFFAVDGGACNTCVSAAQTSDAQWSWEYCDSTNGPCYLNEQGCADIALGEQAQEKGANPPGTGSCGDILSALYGCESYACSSCTATTDQSACIMDTESSGTTKQCGSYETPLNATTGPCAVLNGDAAPASASNCFLQSQDATSMQNFINMFCGTGP